MPYWIGVDEAGYGPNLGPLTISATLWRTEHERDGLDLYVSLATAISGSATPGDERLVIADSKLLYKPQGGLRKLERGIFAAWEILETVPTSWQQLWDVLHADPAGARHQIPWYQGHDRKLPTELALETLLPAVAKLREGLAAAQTRLCGVRSRAVFPREFNERIERFGTKGAALSHTTLELLASVMEPLEDDAIFVVCDKHGGRSRYQELLQQMFPEHLVEIRCEGRAESVYRLGPPPRRVEIAFRSRGEAFLPAALASMVCKYLREVSMQAFNDYWCAQIPQLRATAGYPQDAKRFRAEIAPLQKKLGIEDHVLWRNR